MSQAEIRSWLKQTVIMVIVLGLCGAVLEWMWVSAGWYSSQLGAAMVVTACGVMGAWFPERAPGPAPTWRLATWTAANMSWMTGLVDLVVDPYLAFGMQLLVCAPVFVLSWLACAFAVGQRFSSSEGHADEQADQDAQH